MLPQVSSSLFPPTFDLTPPPPPPVARILQFLLPDVMVVLFALQKVLFLFSFLFFCFFTQVKCMPFLQLSVQPQVNLSPPSAPYTPIHDFPSHKRSHVGASTYKMKLHARFLLSLGYSWQCF